eukprot:8047566-Pyramimonas_sp.AAC.1
MHSHPAAAHALRTVASRTCERYSCASERTRSVKTSPAVASSAMRPMTPAAECVTGNNWPLDFT